MTTQTPQLAAADEKLTAARGFAGGYGATPSAIDEMIEPDGSLRPHWRLFVSMLDELGPEELPRRWEQARRLIRENGITHNVYGDPNGLDRPWNLDLVPLLITAGEWRVVSTALAQRARLLNALMADLYGPARCVNEGLLPPELLYANPGFLRPLHGVVPPRGQWLHLYAADLIRTTDGQFQVLADRTQSPSGAGYTLENRIVLSGVLNTLFRECNVYRLAPFFMTLRQTLLSLAPANRENPRVVLLTPGPYNETYFEHSYLARYLGYTLVQGNDLTVRDGRVFLKTLSGLQRVDVILRRVDDEYCDPLELYQSSFLGVPGLVEAVREGNVAVANALGTGLLQTPAFLSFLPALCKRLLDEELAMPSVRTWWCGDEAARRYVLEHLGDLVIKPAFPTPGSDPVFGEDMTRDQKADLAARIAACPGDFVAQEKVISRTAPVLLEDQVEARRFVVRAFLSADNNAYTVMPGGLTRVTSADSIVVSLQKGGGSKDTWILADGPVNEATLLTTASQPVVLSRGGGDLPSRVADDLFWLGRYVQRAEANLRVARSLFGRLLESSRPQNNRAAAALARLLLGSPNFILNESSADVLIEELFAPVGSGGLRPSIGHVRGLVRALRDRVSADAWRILQNIERELAEFDTGSKTDQVVGAVTLLNRLTAGFLAFGGVVSESMTRGQAWRFLDMGNRLERAMGMSRLLRATLVHVAPEESPLLEAALEIGDSALTYRRRYLTQLQATAVADLLIADDTNPRAIAFQVAALEDHLARLPSEGTHPQRSPHKQLILRLRARLQLADLGELCEPRAAGVRTGLDALLVEVTRSLEDVAQVISQIYFSHAAVSRPLSGQGEEMLR